MGNVVSMTGAELVTPERLVSDLKKRSPDIIVAVERKDGRWLYSFTHMTSEDRLACVGALRKLEQALLR